MNYKYVLPSSQCKYPAALGPLFKSVKLYCLVSPNLIILMGGFFPNCPLVFPLPYVLITWEVKRMHQDTLACKFCLSLLLSGFCITTHKPFVFMASLSRILSSSLLLSGFCATSLLFSWLPSLEFCLPLSYFLASAPQSFCFHGFPISRC